MRTTILFVVALTMASFATVMAQQSGQAYSENVSLLSENLYGGFAAGNLSVWRNPSTDNTYALLSMDWGLDIINVTDPSDPEDEVQINENGHARGDRLSPDLSVEDVAVYQGSGDAYAYLARAVTGINPYIIVIDINAALAHGGTYLITPGSPDGTIYVSDIHNPNTSNQGFVGWQAHTLNIANGILYVATQTHNIGVYSLAAPSQPALLDSLVMPASPNTAAPYSDQTVHQIVARSTGSNTATLYVADTRGGIRIVNVTGLQSTPSISSITTQIYDFDKTSPTTVTSSDPYYDWRICHTVWPNSDGSYLFSTDELGPGIFGNYVRSSADPNLHPASGTPVLTDIFRQGGFMRIWKTSALGSAGALVSGYYVPEGSATGITTLSNMGNYGDVPNSIHQMYVWGDTMYVSYYTQGLRILDVTNPTSPTEIGYYDDISTMDTVLNSSRLFRLSNVNANGYPNAFQGLWGVVPDVNHPGIIYGSGSEGLNVYGLYSRTLSGTVSSNTTLSGVVNVTGNVTVNSGATLTINPGTVLAFSSGFTLTVDGVLHAVGTGTQPITFTSTGSTSPGSWGSIVFSGSGSANSIMDHCDVAYEYDMEVNNTSNVTIEHSYIANSYGAGIWFDNSTGCSATGNRIAVSSSSYEGIYCFGSTVNCDSNVVYTESHSPQSAAGILYDEGSSGTITVNDIRYCDWGIGATWGSSPTSYVSRWNGSARNNRITNCTYGLLVYANSYPNFGPIQTSPYSYNSIYGNTYNVGLNIYGSTVSTLSAAGNYWNTSNPSSTFALGSGSQVSWQAVDPYDPWSGYPLPGASQRAASGEVNIASVAAQASGPGITVAGTSPASSAGDSLLIGLQLREQDKTTDAMDFFINFLTAHPDDQAAYVYLCSCADSTTLPELIGYFQSLPAQAAKENQLLLGSLYQREGRYDLAEQLNDSIISDNPNTPLKVKAEMNNLFIDVFDKSDLQGAAVLLSNIESDSNQTTPIELRNAEMAVALHAQPSVLPMAGSQKVTSISASNLPKAYGISQNYPNPFKPTTVIDYQLPKDSHVSLKIYDVLGREVASLVDGDEKAGYHQVTFDGSSFASGVYFYRLSTPNFSKVQKMILMK